MNNYDCTQDVKYHIMNVKQHLDNFIYLLEGRSRTHDRSKLSDPIEKELFDHWAPQLRELTFGTDEYKVALDGMGEGVKLHYKANRHHPEHYENGVNGMTLVDLLEMIADWMASAERKDTFVDLENGGKRFDLSDQLVEIIANTLREEDVWNAANGHPTRFCPPERSEGHVEGFETTNERKPK